MTIKMYQVDAFTDTLFGGNPAAICPLSSWPDDELLLSIAQENNLAETAYFLPLDEGRYHLRWFTPELEMDLCGHATLASAYVIFHELGLQADEVIFETKSGLLTVKKKGELLEMDLPSRPPIAANLPPDISAALSIQPTEVWKARDYLLLYESATDIRELSVDEGALKGVDLGPGGIIVTALGDMPGVDFVSRFFTPGAAVFEDPVTGSAHCTLIPYWTERSGRSQHVAHQLSSRGGQLFCEQREDRVIVRGQAVKYLEGEIHV